ncbi:MAG: T9SS type B sorting domain-containing protein [Aurantibacter sp.]
MKEKLTSLIFMLAALATLGQECPKINFPLDGSTNVPVDVTITWPEVSGINGYLISLGTTPGGTDLLQREATGINNFYKAPVGLPENTLIYATISILLFNATPMECESTPFTTMDVTSPPPCTILIAPDDNAANVTVVTDIIWQYSPTATSYTLSIGTSEGGTDILDAVNLGNVLSYDPPVDLPQDIRIFVTVVPENENGHMAPCNEESFFTGAVDDPCEEVDEITGEITSFGPDIELPSRFALCKNGGSINVSAEGQADGFRWYSVENGQETLLAENRNFRITDIGNYLLETYNFIVHSGITIECLSSNSFNVVASEIAVIESVDIKNLTAGKQVTINAVGEGDYEYTIDDENGPYQDNPTFHNIGEGSHVIYVRDKNGCGTVSQLIERELKLEDFPNFFTPNGDGINDFWQFIAPVENAKVLEIVSGTISVFDRYGSLLVQIDPKSEGWDGSFNGKPLPSSDYWFRAVSFDKQEITGHFTLKR